MGGTNDIENHYRSVVPKATLALPAPKNSKVLKRSFFCDVTVQASLSHTKKTYPSVSIYHGSYLLCNVTLTVGRSFLFYLMDEVWDAFS